MEAWNFQVSKTSSPQDLKTSVTVDRATGTKCERCWRYVPEVSQDAERAGLCRRCVDALAEPVSL